MLCSFFLKALEKVEEALRSEKSLSRYREEQNMNESDMNLSGFVNRQSVFSEIKKNETFFLGYSSLCKYVYKMWNEY